MAIAAQSDLLERDEELAALDEMVRRARAGDGGVIAIAGVGGIGKTSLLNALCRRAEDEATVLTARATEVERELGFGVVRQLFERTLRSASEELRAKLLAGAAALGAPALGMSLDAAPAAIDPSFAPLHGIYWITVNLAAEKPLVLAVDDAQWADTQSLNCVEYLRRRLEGLPVLLAVTVRTDGEETPPPLLDDPATRVVHPRAFSEEATAAYVRTTLAAEPSRRFAASCHTATGGNPFLLTELLRSAAADGLAPGDETAGRVGELAPASVSRAVLARIARFGTAASRAAAAVAVLGEPARLGQIAAVAALPQPEATAAVEALVGAGVLVEDEGRFGFDHPLVRSAIYADISLAERIAAHDRAAQLLTEEGAGAQKVAAQLLRSDPPSERWAVATLEAAAGEAQASDSPRSAITFLGRALLEPSSDPVRRRLLRSLGRAQAQAGDFVAAEENIESALALLDDRRERAQARRELAQILLLTGRATAAVELLDQAIGELTDADAELGLELEADLARAGQVTLAARALTNARTPRFEPPAGALPPLALAHRAMETVMTDQAEAAAGDARQALDAGLLAAQTSDSPSFYMAANALLFAGEAEGALGVYDEALADARARGSGRGFALASCCRAIADYSLGDIPGTEVDARAGLDVYPFGLGVALPVAVAYLAIALVERGELEEAQGVIDRYPMGGPLTGTLFFSHHLIARARLALARQDHDLGAELLRECGQREADWGVSTPALTQWRALLAPFLLVGGEADEARRLAAEEVERCRTFGSPRHLGVALRAAALVEEGEPRVAGLTDAADLLAETPARLEHARAVVDLGTALRQARRRRDARNPLAEGLRIARECGATALAKHAHAELEATGARPRKIVRSGVEELTASERRVCEMAAAGLSNKEIAQALFVTVKTVETHLSRAYLKLEIGSRGELAEALTPPA